MILKNIASISQKDELTKKFIRIIMKANENYLPILRRRI